ncbi:MAG: carboxypeptidase regulatory-like domain-containing protein [Bryobacteraceae bacterium]
MPRSRWLYRVLAGVLWAGGSIYGATTVTGKVADENGLAVAGARLELRAGEDAERLAAVSDSSGNFLFTVAAPGDYLLRAERQGFFVLAGRPVRLVEGANHIAVTLNRLREFAESVDVIFSPPAIDMQEPSEKKEINSIEILQTPYPASQDIRSAFPLFQGVVQDNQGQVHFNGGAANQTYVSLDGFNVADPVTGLFEARMNVETVRSVDLESHRFSAEKGRGSAGSVDLKTGMGDDRWRFSTTNFVPGVSTEGGVHVNKWTPRVKVSGPLKRSRAWFHHGFDAFYDVDMVPELPSGQNRTRSVTTSTLTRFQVNLTPSNVLTSSFLTNYIDANRHGLTFLSPIETTLNRRQNFFMSTIRDQMYFRRGALLDVGFADSRGLSRENPQGAETFEILPHGKRGNYFVDRTRHTYRQQWVANLFLPSLEFGGTHQFKMGADLQRSSFDQSVVRHDYRVLRADHTLARHVSFVGDGLLGKSNFETAFYLQDRWTPRAGLMIEAGARTDWDQVTRNIFFSPRFAVAYAPEWLRETKLAAGYGVYYDALNLGTISQHQDQTSLSTFFTRAGDVRRGPVETSFVVNENEIRLPRYQSLSLTVDRQLPLGLYGRAAYSRRKGRRGFTFVNQLAPFSAASLGGGSYLLRNWRNDRYDALEFSVRRTFGTSEWSGGYVRSSARSDAVIDYSLEDPIFAPQGPGPFFWDAPNRFLTWGWVPVPRRLAPRFLERLTRDLEVAYLVEYRTGFPFSVVDEEGFLVGAPNKRRLPAYFNVNLHFEKKFRFLHYLWAWRFGLNNLTNHGNPNVVDNNLDSPGFLSYGRGQQRAFNVRLRFLGRK